MAVAHGLELGLFANNDIIKLMNTNTACLILLLFMETHFYSNFSFVFPLCALTSRDFRLSKTGIAAHEKIQNTDAVCKQINENEQ